ncbi:hypothetical protein LK537_07780 [Lachnoclostridium pacaense]|uniref:hypothetical protein n=1 Tax=Enterocloster hominis (ex Hitch et al. 2024) TaxID=1917870 RepID=UPI001D111EA6|nr:hypothetical protein [Lachnoclostridium pacaense]MCC2817185.1 hypothetical protein [Lachnoclostridium pacaense]
MRKLSFKNRKPPVIKPFLRILIYLAALVFSILSIVETMYGYLGFAVDIIIYVAAACGLAVSSCYIYYDVTVGFRKMFWKVIDKSKLAERLYKDYRYRALFSTVFAFLLNLLYAAGNGIYAKWTHSAWLGTLSAYYLFLCIMRFLVIRQEFCFAKEHIEGKRKRAAEWNVLRNAGILLSFITLVLGGAVVLLLHEEGGKVYSGYLIFAVAAYTFYKITISVINMIKVRRMKSPLLLTIRNIGYADALVSILFLQTAMFTAFSDGKEINKQLMNEMTGGAVCAMILLIGIFMVRKAAKERKNIVE